MVKKVAEISEKNPKYYLGYKKHTRKVLEAINRFGFEQVFMICKDTIKDLVLTRLDSSRVYDVQFDKIKESSIISPIVGE